MSLGWQCESAILPSKAKPISVDSKSIIGLKALVYNEEQKRTANKDTNNRHLGAHKSKTLSSSFTDKFEQKAYKNDPLNQATKKVKHLESEEDIKESRVMEALIAKSRLYDEIRTGAMCTTPSLINFECRQAVSDEPLHSAPTHFDQDEYGRDKPSQYQWSTGQQSSIDNYKNEKLKELEFHRIVAERVQNSKQIDSSSHLRSENDDSNCSSSSHTQVVSDAARVKTQWEKTLNNSARDFLDEVHRSTLIERQQLQQPPPATTTAITNKDNNNNIAANKKRSMREERLEMLKLKQQRVTQT